MPAARTILMAAGAGVVASWSALRYEASPHSAGFELAAAHAGAAVGGGSCPARCAVLEGEDDVVNIAGGVVFVAAVATGTKMIGFADELGRLPPPPSTPRSGPLREWENGEARSLTRLQCAIRAFRFKPRIREGGSSAHVAVAPCAVRPAGSAVVRSLGIPPPACSGSGLWSVIAIILTSIITGMPSAWINLASTYGLEAQRYGRRRFSSSRTRHVDVVALRS